MKTTNHWFHFFYAYQKGSPPSRNAQEMLYLTCYYIFIFYRAGLLFHCYLKQRKYIKSKDFKTPRHCTKLSWQLRSRAVLSLKRIHLNCMQAPKPLQKFAYEHFLSVLSKVEIHLEQAEGDEALVQRGKSLHIDWTTKFKQNLCKCRFMYKLSGQNI